MIGKKVKIAIGPGKTVTGEVIDKFMGVAEIMVTNGQHVNKMLVVVSYYWIKADKLYKVQCDKILAEV